MKRINLIIKTINIIYPLPLILLVFSPILIGFFIDFDLFDSRIIAINLVWIPIFTIPFILLKTRFGYHLISTLYFCIGMIELTHWIIIKGPLTTTSLLVISNTNLQESFEFFNLKGSIFLLLLFPYLYIYIKTLQNKPYHFQSNISPYIIGIVLLFSVVFIGENALNSRLIRKGVPQAAKVTFSFIHNMKLYKEVNQDVKPKKINATHTSKQQTVVLVIGESCNRNHMSLYGAKRRTTPKLDNRSDLFTFKNVVSPYSNTINSVLTILSESDLENKISFKKNIDIIDIFHSANFKTFWISNQNPVGVWDNQITIFAKKSDHLKFVNTTSNSSFESILNSSYDSKILKPFESALLDSSNNKFIVLHLLGNHSSYVKRYPSSFNIFKGYDDKSKTIAEYDNSILYNDFIVDSLIKTLEKRESESISFIYLSDHGENVYDEFDNVGHDYSTELPKSNVEIPFLVWLSENYINLNPQITKTLHENLNLPFISDNLFHSIMDLSHIKSPYFIKEKSIFNYDYNDSRKRILEDGKDYDR